MRRNYFVVFKLMELVPCWKHHFQKFSYIKGKRHIHTTGHFPAPLNHWMEDLKAGKAIHREGVGFHGPLKAFQCHFQFFPKTGSDLLRALCLRSLSGCDWSTVLNAFGGKSGKVPPGDLWPPLQLCYCLNHQPFSFICWTGKQKSNLALSREDQK